MEFGKKLYIRSGLSAETPKRNFHIIYNDIRHSIQFHSVIIFSFFLVLFVVPLFPPCSRTAPCGVIGSRRNQMLFCFIRFVHLSNRIRISCIVRNYFAFVFLCFGSTGSFLNGFFVSSSVRYCTAPIFCTSRRPSIFLSFIVVLELYRATYMQIVRS